MSYRTYILANSKRGNVYIGMTNNLARRVQQHRQGCGSLYAKTYGTTRVVHVEVHRSKQEAITRERQLKKWRRTSKMALIERTNPSWRDLTKKSRHRSKPKRRW